MTDWVVVPVDVEDVIALRHRVLRAPAPVETACFDGDGDRASVHVAVRSHEDVIGVGSMIPEACPDQASERPLRIRGMAVEPGWRGAGIGSAVLDALLAHARAVDSDLVWCRARLPALALYTRAGFQPTSEVYDSAGLGPHVTMRWVPDPRPV